MKKLLTLLSLLTLGISSLTAQFEDRSIAEVSASLPDSFSTLTLALVKSDLAKVLNNDGDFTVFAPTNAAFDAAAQALLEDDEATGAELILLLDKETLTDILLYHVVPGKFVSGEVLATETFTTANGEDIMVDAGSFTIVGGQDSFGPLNLGLIDLHAANGVVHVIDGVLLPPINMDPVSIYQTAAGNPAFSTLVSAIDKAGLKYVLDNDRYHLTVFAPVNEAFDATAKIALNDENATGEELVDTLSSWQLRRILLNHVLWGEFRSEDVLARDSFRTLGWSRLYRTDLTLDAKNGSGTLIPELIDIDATNGVVHVVDGVLLP